MALVHRELGELKESATYLEKLFLLDRSDARVAVELVECYLELAEHDRALEVLDGAQQAGVVNERLTELRRRVL